MAEIDSDIDIDVLERDDALKAIGNYRMASIINDGVIKPHNVGVYLQKIPTYLGSNIASFDYKSAPRYGFYKIDVLTNTVYEGVKDETHLDMLLNTEPKWSMLEDHEVVKQLFQIHRYGERLSHWKPTSVLQLAMFIAMIRPSKKHLLYVNSWDIVEREIWTPPMDATQYFKKSHAIAYASALVVQMNLLLGL